MVDDDRGRCRGQGFGPVRWQQVAASRLQSGSKWWVRGRESRDKG